MNNMMESTTKSHLLPAKTDQSGHPLESWSLCCADYGYFLQADSKDSDQTERMPRLI